MARYMFVETVYGKRKGNTLRVWQNVQHTRSSHISTCVFILLISRIIY